MGEYGSVLRHLELGSAVVVSCILALSFLYFNIKLPIQQRVACVLSYTAVWLAFGVGAYAFIMLAVDVVMDNH